MPLYSREDAEKACIEAIERARAVNNNTADKQYKIKVDEFTVYGSLLYGNDPFVHNVNVFIQFHNSTEDAVPEDQWEAVSYIRGYDPNVEEKGIVRLHWQKKQEYYAHLNTNFVIISNGEFDEEAFEWLKEELVGIHDIVADKLAHPEKYPEKIALQKKEPKKKKRKRKKKKLTKAEALQKKKLRQARKLARALAAQEEPQPIPAPIPEQKKPEQTITPKQKQNIPQQKKNAAQQKPANKSLITRVVPKMQMVTLKTTRNLVTQTSQDVHAGHEHLLCGGNATAFHSPKSKRSLSWIL